MFNFIIDPPSMPTLLSSSIETDRVNLAWRVLGVDEGMQRINYFILQVNDQQPVAIRNTTVTLFTGSRNTSHTLRLRAVDMCGQMGEELVETLEVMGTSSPDTTTQPATCTTPQEGSSSTTSAGEQVGNPTNAAEAPTCNVASLIALVMFITIVF